MGNQIPDIIITGFEIFQLLIKTRKATGLKSLRVNCWEINQVTSNVAFQFKQSILNFGSKFSKKCISGRKRSNFWSKLPKNRISRRKQKGEYHRWIWHIRLGLGVKFHFKHTILNFWTKFAQKGYFRSKTEKVNITTEFLRFELVMVPNLSLNCQF